MNKNSRIIQRIEKKYVLREFLEVILEYKKSLLLVGNNEVIYHDEDGYDQINKFLTDKRKKQFPKLKESKKNKKLTSQIIDFNVPYFRIQDDINSICFAIKDGKEAIFVNDFLIPTEQKIRFMTRGELERFFSSSKSELKLFRYDGRLTNNLEIPSDDDILDLFRLEVLEKYVYNMSDDAIRVLAPIVNSASSSTISKNFQFMEDNILVIKSSESDLSISYVSIRYEDNNWFKLISNKVPVTKYTLEQIKEITKQIDEDDNQKIDAKFPSKIRTKLLGKNYKGIGI